MPYATAAVPPPPIGSAGSINRRRAVRMVVIGQAVAAMLLVAAAGLYVLAANSPSNTSPMAGVAVAAGIAVMVLGTIGAIGLGALAAVLRRDGAAPTTAAVIVEGGLVLVAVTLGFPIGLLLAGSAVFALGADPVARPRTPRPIRRRTPLTDRRRRRCGQTRCWRSFQCSSRSTRLSSLPLSVRGSSSRSSYVRGRL